jgi:hypothetical protein
VHRFQRTVRPLAAIRVCYRDAPTAAANRTAVRDPIA